MLVGEAVASDPNEELVSKSNFLQAKNTSDYICYERRYREIIWFSYSVGNRTTVAADEGCLTSYGG